MVSLEVLLFRIVFRTNLYNMKGVECTLYSLFNLKIFSTTMKNLIWSKHRGTNKVYVTLHKFLDKINTGQQYRNLREIHFII